MPSRRLRSPCQRSSAGPRRRSRRVFGPRPETRRAINVTRRTTREALSQQRRLKPLSAPRLRADPPLADTCPVNNGRKDWSAVFPSVGSWFLVLLVVTALVGVLYGPIFLLDLWGARAWARENPGANVVMWVIFGTFWVLILWAVLSPGGLSPERERQVLAAGHPPCPESGQRQAPPQGNGYVCPTCRRAFYDEALAFREFVMPVHLTKDDATSVRRADKRAEKREDTADSARR